MKATTKDIKRLNERLHYASSKEMKDILCQLALDWFLEGRLKKPEYGSVARILIEESPSYQKMRKEKREKDRDKPKD